MTTIHESETKYIGGNVIEVKEATRNGQPVGIVSGYIATWDVDRGDWTGVKDQFKKGAFIESILQHMQKARQIRLKDHHGRTIGGFPIDQVKEDERGLYGVGEINLNVQQGREAFALAKQGVLSDFSIGFTPEEVDTQGNIRTISKATVWEGSIVDEPMNPHANITQVKGVTSFQDFPLADRETTWSSSAAVKRIREYSKSTDEPSSSYKKYFLWYDSSAPDNFGSYKMPIADIIDGKPEAVPRAIFAAAVVLNGGRGGVDIPDADKKKAKAHLERYYKKMDMESPFNKDFEGYEIPYYGIEDVKDWTAREIEDALRDGARFSKTAARALIGKMDVAADPFDEVLKGLREIKTALHHA